MSLARILAISQRIVRQFKHDKRTLGLLFIVPIIVISLIGSLLRATPVYSIGIINNDNLKLSEQVTDSLDKQDNTRVFNTKESEISEVLRDEKAIVVITFSNDFSKALMAGKPVKLDVEIDGSNPARAQVVLAKIQQALLSQGKPGLKPSLDVNYKYGGTNFDSLDFGAPTFITFFAFFFVFLLTSVSFLRERGQGTIERLMSSPASGLEIILGYLIGFILFATIQVAIILLYTIYVLKVHYIGDIVTVFLVEFLLTLVAVNMGIFFSSFAANELQVIQFIPIVITPQALLSGMLIPVKDLPQAFQWLAQIMPLTYANRALQLIMLKGFSLKEVAGELLFLVIFALLMIILSSATIRRKIA